MESFTLDGERCGLAGAIALHALPVGDANGEARVECDGHAQTMNHLIMNECLCRPGINQGTECSTPNADKELHRIGAKEADQHMKRYPRPQPRTPGLPDHQAP
jgi:hypothetical protein